MVADLIRDTAFGHIVRLVTRNKVFQYPEERDHEIWKKYANQEKSGNMARHGAVGPPENSENETAPELASAQGVRDRERDSRSSSQTQVAEGVNAASGVRVDPEKGRDKHVIDWYGDDDPQVRLSSYTSASACRVIADGDVNRIHATGLERRSSLSRSRSASLPSRFTLARQSTRLVLWTSWKSSVLHKFLLHWA